MSDGSDSEWEEEEDERTTAEPTNGARLPLEPAASSSHGAVAAAPAPSVVALSPPSVLLALPITLALKDQPPPLGTGIPAGVTLLYDAAKNAITLVAYDEHKR